IEIKLLLIATATESATKHSLESASYTAPIGILELFPRGQSKHRSLFRRRSLRTITLDRRTCCHPTFRASIPRVPSQIARLSSSVRGFGQTTISQPAVRAMTQSGHVACAPTQSFAHIQPGSEYDSNTVRLRSILGSELVGTG